MNASGVRYDLPAVSQAFFFYHCRDFKYDNDLHISVSVHRHFNLQYYILGKIS